MKYIVRRNIQFHYLEYISKSPKFIPIKYSEKTNLALRLNIYQCKLIIKNAIKYARQDNQYFYPKNHFSIQIIEDE